MIHLDFAILLKVYPFILRGTWVTLQLVVLVLLVSTPLGLLLALARNARPAWVSAPTAVASWMVRGVPPLLILFFVYFALPQFGLAIEPFPAAVAGMSIYTAFYFAEAIRSGLAAVPASQYQAARALALPPLRSFIRVILPQALPPSIPPYVSYATEVVKGSALTASIAVAETMGNAYQLILSTNRPLEILLLVAAIYAAIDTVLIVLQGYAERRWKPRARR